MINYYLVGRHSHRTPLSYSNYISRSKGFFLKVDEPYLADILVFGFIIDIKENEKFISDCLKIKPELKLVVLSEEPIWDTVWSGDFRQKLRSIKVLNDEIKVYYLNHFNSDIFGYRNIPYYITTESKFLSRYRLLIERNLEYGIQNIRQHLKKVKNEAYFLERRDDPRYSFDFPDVSGLSVFRSQLAMKRKSSNKDCLLEGKGWDRETPRQSLVDWHLDKISKLDRNFLFTSAIENTDAENYMSEKYFDSLASLTIPIVKTKLNKKLLRAFDQDICLNLDGLSLESSNMKINNFKLTDSFIDSYISTLRYWLNLFQSIDLIEFEYTSRINKIYNEINDFL